MKEIENYFSMEMLDSRQATDIFFDGFVFLEKSCWRPLHSFVVVCYYATHCVEITPIKKVAKSFFNVFGKS